MRYENGSIATATRRRTIAMIVALLVTSVTRLADAAGFAPCTAGCSSPQSCTIDGMLNTSLGDATLSINDECHLTVNNIGPSGQDGFAQAALPARTREFVTTFDCPNFLESSADARENVIVYAEVPGGVFYRFEVENIGDGMMEMRPDFSPVGATRYTITVLNDGVVTGTFRDLSFATFRMALDDQEEIN